MRGSIFAAIAIVLIAAAPLPLLACSCAEILTVPGEALEKSGLVFSGEVEKIETVVLPRVVFTEDDNGRLVASQHMVRRALVTFRVIADWNGDRPERYRVLAGAPPERPLKEGQVLRDCEVHFETGKRYLVFTTFGYPEANACAPTAALEESEATVAALDTTASKRK